MDTLKSTGNTARKEDRVSQELGPCGNPHCFYTLPPCSHTYSGTEGEGCTPAPTLGFLYWMPLLSPMASGLYITPSFCHQGIFVPWTFHAMLPLYIMLPWGSSQVCSVEFRTEIEPHEIVQKDTLFRAKSEINMSP